MFGRLIAVVLAVLAFAPPAFAQDGRWWRAESPNFIVFGDRNEAQVRRAALVLENFDATLRFLTSAPSAAVENKLEVFLLRDDDISDVWPGVRDEIGGFYMSGNEQIAVFVRDNDQVGFDRHVVLFHEYAHHFMLHYFPHAYPRWYVEGWAEYVSTVQMRDGRAHVGIPSQERGSMIAQMGGLPIEQLLAPERVQRPPPMFIFEFYANSWLAASYIANNRERRQGLNQYVLALGDGADAIEAFQPAFGITPQAFERELRAFRRVQTFSIPLPASQPAIATTRLPRSADDLLLHSARMRSMGPALQAPHLDAAERDAARFPDDPAAQIVLARAATFRQSPASARAHLERVLAANETHAEARYLMADLLLTEAGKKEGEEAYNSVLEARRHLVRGFRANPNHYPTLYLYAATFTGGSAPMEETQLNVLARALELAPQVDQIRLLLARELIKADLYENAVVTLRPLIYAPHGGAGAARARVLFAAAQAREQPSEQAEAAAETTASEQ